jgi:hypothetical protein
MSNKWKCGNWEAMGVRYRTRNLVADDLQIIHEDLAANTWVAVGFLISEMVPEVNLYD